MPGEAAKRSQQQHHNNSSSSDSSSNSTKRSRAAGPLAGLCICLHGSIPSLQKRLNIIQRRLDALGATTAAATAPLPPAVTHVVISLPSTDAGGSDGSGSGSSAAGYRASSGGKGAAISLDQLLQGVQQHRQQQQQPTLAPQSTQAAAAAAAVVRHVLLVSDAWLDAVLTSGQHVPEQPYLLGPHAGSSSSSDDQGRHSVPAAAAGWLPLGRPLDPGSVPAPDAPLGKYAAWLGRWCPEFNSITSQIELVLQASFSAEASARRGPNEAVYTCLRELMHYEEALGGPQGLPNEPGTAGGQGDSGVNHQALTYAHAAAVVRGCAFPLSAAMSAKQLQQTLPLVGRFTAGFIYALLTTSTCQQLDLFRTNQAVRSSKGQLRAGTAGASSRRQFVRLPGVGPVMARRWWSLGFTSIDQVLVAAEAADSAASAQAGGSGAAPAAGTATGAGVKSTAVRLVDGGGAETDEEEEASASPAALWLPAAGFSISRAALYSLRFHKDLFEPVSQEDQLEMQQVVMSAVQDVTGVATGWRLLVVGGGRRSQASHDADFLVTHDSYNLDGVVEQVYLHLVAAGLLVPYDEGFCQLRRGRLPGLKERLRREVISGVKDRGAIDKYDHIYGICIPSSGKRRRLDVILVPPEQWPFAVMGWTGSKQWLRFVRQYTGNRGILLGSHCIFRKVPAPAAEETGGAAGGAADAAQACGSQLVLSVPDEAPPADRDGRDWWRPGWEPAAAITAGSGVAAAGPASVGGGARRVVETEEHIFELMGLPYRAPAEREA